MGGGIALESHIPNAETLGVRTPFGVRPIFVYTSQTQKIHHLL